MRIAIGSDHGGFLLKEDVKKYLSDNGYEVKDFGCNGLESVDYPEYAHKVAYSVSTSEVVFGILICTTGVGMSIASNKVKGIRACLAGNIDMCKMSREHNDANVLCLGAKYVDTHNAILYIDTFLKTPFAGGRHQRRVNAIEIN